MTSLAGGKMQGEAIASLLIERLQPISNELRAEFQQRRTVPTRYLVVDNVLPAGLAQEVYAAFPPVTEMRLLDSFRERKYTSKALGKMKQILSDVTFAFQVPEVIQIIETITGLPDMVGDPLLYAGGISTMLQGHFLNPHLDNSHDAARQYYRVLNLLYYVTPGWQAENGGNLELWDTQVKRRVEIPSLFNRLVIMETQRHSWHSVNRVQVTGQRCCVSNYFFSPHPPGGSEYFHITSFIARPEQPVRRALTRVDTVMRSSLRKAIKQGIGRKDLYKGND
jgi:Rps23 Pro-64 3,4-dihydroxylase Tpa1-like proline 4-hydroxylase